MAMLCSQGWGVPEEWECAEAYEDGGEGDKTITQNER